MDSFPLMPSRLWFSTYSMSSTILLRAPLRFYIASFFFFFFFFSFQTSVFKSDYLQVLYRFLEFFSNFDWDNFCVSLWGPVPINSLPDVTGNSILYLLSTCYFYLMGSFVICNDVNVTAEPPRKDSGELLLNKVFLDACSSVYAVFPAGQDSQGQPFLSKHFNVIDPLRVSNNLGRSVSKGNSFSHF